MFQAIRTFRAKLAEGRFCLGVGITLNDPAVTESLGRHADFFWVDLEHTALGMESLQAHLMAARAVNVPALVRVPGSETWFIKRVLDTGANGLIVPQVRSAEEVKRVVDACRYKPLGDRGYGPRRASNYGADQHYLDTANKDLFVAVQIENMDALAEVESIAAIPGLDSLVLGPFDLAASMGFLGKPDHSQVQAAIKHVIGVAKSRGLKVGMGGPAQEDYAFRAAQTGVDWLQCGSDFEYMSQFIGPFFGRLHAKLSGGPVPGSTSPS